MLNAKAICCAIRGQPQLGLRRFISTTAAMSSVLGPFGPGLRRRFGENSMRYFCWLKALWRPSSVAGFSTIADRSRRVGRTKSAIKPARMRSDAHRFGDRCLGPIHDQELVLEEERLRNYGTGATRSEQAGQGCDEVDEKNDQIAHHRIVAGRGILRNLGRNNNSPATPLSLRGRTHSPELRFWPKQFPLREPSCTRSA